MSKKLLLADDSITIQKVIGITFANEDYSLCVVDNGDAALEKARSEQPDLILADVFMPGKNGYELCAAIKAEVGLQQIPVLLLAGTFEPFDEAKARKAGADGWIAKPFESQALIDRVEDLLARPRTPAVAPPPAPAPAAALAAPVTAALAVEEEDTEPDLWAELGPVAAPLIDVPEAPAAEALGAAPVPEVDGLSADTGSDDLWGEVSLGEEDLVPVAAAATSKDIWADLDVPALETSRPTPTATSDLWDDLPAATEPAPAAGELGPSSFGAVLEEEEEEVFLTLEDEDETVDLLEPAAEDVEEEEAFIFVEDDDLAQDLTVAATQPSETATTFFAAEPAEEELLELDDSDIMALDDVDIVEEGELELPADSLNELAELDGATEGVEAALAAHAFEDLAPGDLPTLANDDLDLLPAAGEEPIVLDDAFDDLLLGDLSPVTAAAVEVSGEEPVSLLVDSQMEETPLWDVVEPAMEELVEIEPEPVAERAVAAPQVSTPAPSVAPIAPALTAAAAEAQVQGLSEADLTRIVERVAGEVIEKLAGTILERLAWEVVPDLAETLIREEIRKIRDNVA